MYYIENFLEIVEGLLTTKRRKHLTGGILISLSALFGGLAITALTVRPEEKENDDEYE